MLNKRFMKLALPLLLLAVSSPAEAVVPFNLNVATWNLHPRSINGVTPQQRARDAALFGANQNIHLIALQEVPINGFLQNPIALDAITAGTTYRWSVLDREYPIGSTPANTSPSGYLFLYDSTVMTPTGLPVFFHPNAFPQGLAQARPPVAIDFNVTNQAGNQGTLQFLSWHNEAASMASGHVDQLDQTVGLCPMGQHWVIAGDYNVEDVSPTMSQFIHNRGHLTHGGNGIDHVVSNVNVSDLPAVNAAADTPPPNLNLPRLRSDGRHLFLAASVAMSLQ